jgi:PAS domain S-box-containing protein
VSVGERRPDPARELEDARREAEYYRRIAEEAGTRRLREAEALSQLLERAREAERALEKARDELEARVAERTAELTVANAHLSRVVEERERAEIALRASEEAFRSFMAHFPGLAYIKEADTKVVFANEGFRAYLGLDPEALTGRTNAECFPEPFASQLTRDDRRVLETGRAETIEEEFGGRSWSTHKFVIPRADGAPRLGGLTLDVTEARRSEEERRRLERQMEQAQRIESLGVLAGGIAHDFNNLLAAIQANVAFLRAEAARDHEADACLADVDSAARSAAGLCQQMLAYAGRAPFVAERVDLGTLVRDMVQLLRSSVSRRLGLELRLAKGLPPLEGDPSQLRQVVMNLVINAAEATEDGGGTVTVTTRAVRLGPGQPRPASLREPLADGSYVLLEVADDGCGMDAETQRRIFEPFFTTKFTGRGLGLSAVLGIVRQLRGGIELESAPGRGTRFRVLFPAAQCGGAPEAAAPAADDWTGHGLVLVVDDDDAIRRALARLLGLLGLEALEAASGAEGIELYRRHAGRVRAVVLDLTMPHLDGADTLRALRRLDPEAFVLVASGYAEAEVEARFREEAPNGFLQKPFRLEALRRHLRASSERPERRSAEQRRDVASAS